MSPSTSVAATPIDWSANFFYFDQCFQLLRWYADARCHLFKLALSQTWIISRVVLLYSSWLSNNLNLGLFWQPICIFIRDCKMNRAKWILGISLWKQVPQVKRYLFSSKKVDFLVAALPSIKKNFRNIYVYNILWNGHFRNSSDVGCEI